MILVRQAEEVLGLMVGNWRQAGAFHSISCVSQKEISTSHISMVKRQVLSTWQPQQEASLTFWAADHCMHHSPSRPHTAPPTSSNITCKYQELLYQQGFFFFFFLLFPSPSLFFCFCFNYKGLCDHPSITDGEVEAGDDDTTCSGQPESTKNNRESNQVLPLPTHGAPCKSTSHPERHLPQPRSQWCGSG